MKTSAIITILILILGVHGLVLALVLSGCSASGEKTDAGNEVKAEEKVVQEEVSAEENPNVRRVSLSELAQLVYQKKRAAITQPYDYRGSVEGSIPGFTGGQPGKAGIIVDLETRRVLWSRNARKAVPIASMTKLMTVLVAYEMIMDKRNGLTLETPVKVSAAAYKVGGSQVYLDPRETFTLRELMMAASIQSANDAAYLIAEYLGE